MSSKKWKADNEWLRRPKVKIALAADAAAVSSLCLQLMAKA